MAKPADTGELPPLTDDAGEVRELTAADLARGRRGAPWTHSGETGRLKRALDAVIEAADRQDAKACREIAARALSGEEV